MSIEEDIYWILRLAEHNQLQLICIQRFIFSLPCSKIFGKLSIKANVSIQRRSYNCRFLKSVSSSFWNYSFLAVVGTMSWTTPRFNYQVVSITSCIRAHVYHGSLFEVFPYSYLPRVFSHVISTRKFEQLRWLSMLCILLKISLVESIWQLIVSLAAPSAKKRVEATCAHHTLLIFLLNSQASAQTEPPH